MMRSLKDQDASGGEDTAEVAFTAKCEQHGLTEGLLLGVDAARAQQLHDVLLLQAVQEPLILCAWANGHVSPGVGLPQGLLSHVGQLLGLKAKGGESSPSTAYSAQSA